MNNRIQSERWHNVRYGFTHSHLHFFEPTLQRGIDSTINLEKSRVSLNVPVVRPPHRSSEISPSLRSRKRDHAPRSHKQSAFDSMIPRFVIRSDPTCSPSDKCYIVTERNILVWLCRMTTPLLSHI
jgi:hypothetical protein